MRSGNEIYAHPREQQLVVYDRNNWQVILQDKEESKMVLFNSVDKSLICHSSETLSTNHHNSHQRSSRLPSSPNNSKICPLCKQSVTQESTPAYPQSHSPPREESSYMVRDYFHLINYQFEQEKARDSMPRTQPPPPQSDSLPTESLNSGYYRRFFVEEQKIGAGGYGSVYLCRHMINGIDLGKYAIKKIPVGDNRPWLMRVLREVKALETLKKHPNIINYQHSWLEADKTADFGPEIPCLFILMEFANGGSLADIMFGNKKKYLSEREIWKYFMDICQGLAFLHACGVIHRDIKPHNILLNNVINKEGKTETRLLISDFGTCAMKVRDPTLKRTGATGTIEYVAPELLTKDQFGNWNEAFDEKCDVWSLGVILYEMAFQKLPFPSASYVSARDYENLTNEILGFGGAPIPITHTRSPELVQMIQILMKLNPQDRPLVSEILSSPIIAKLLLQQESKVRNEQGSSSRAPGSGQLRSSSNSCKIVRLPSVDNNLDKMETTQQVMPVVPLRRRSISSGRLPPAHDTYQAKHPPLIPPFLSKYVNRFSKIAFISLLILKLWFCLNTCSVLSNPSPMFLYPVVIAAITQLLLSDARGARLQHYQYALAGLEWLWGVFLFLVGAICIDPDASEDFVIQHAALTLLTITTVYLTNK